MDIKRIFGAAPQQEAEEVQQTTVKAQQNLQQRDISGFAAADSMEVQQQQPLTTPIFMLPAGTTSLPNLERMPVLPHDTNTISDFTGFAEILNYLGVSTTQADLQRAISPYGIFDNPEQMIDYARSKGIGLEAEGYNHGTIDELKQFIDKGIPVLATVEIDGETKCLAVTGYGVDNSKTPPEEYITYRDPYKGNDARMSVAEFEKGWAAGGPEPFGPGYSNYFMAFAPSGTDLPPGRDAGTEATSAMNNGMANLSNGGWRVIHGDGVGERVHGLFQGIGGVVQGGLGIADWLVFSGPAQWVNGQVEGIPVLENIVQPIGDLWNTGGAVIGDVLNGFGSAMDDLGGAFQGLFSGDLSAFGLGVYDAAVDVGGAVVDAVTDAVGGVVDAIGDVFSGW